MRHYLKLKLSGWPHEALEQLRRAHSPAIKHPDRTVADRIIPKTHQLSHVGINREYAGEVDYAWPVPPYSQMHKDIQVTVWVDDQKAPLGDAVVLDRWEKPTTRADWQIIPTRARETLEYSRDLTLAEYRYLMLGEYPREQEDKWVMFFENGTLYIHRSLSGIPVFEVAMQPNRITRAWRAAHPDNPTDANAKLLGDLIEYRCSEARRIFTT